MMKTTVYALLAISLLSLNSCHSEDNGGYIHPVPEPFWNDRVDISLSRTEEAVSDKVQEFSLNLIKETLQSEGVKGKNLFFSPWGVAAELNMVANGADENTATEIYSALRPDGCTIEDWNKFYSRLNPLLPFIDRIHSLGMGCSLWVNNAFSVKSSYTDCVKYTSGLEVYVKDFSSPQATQDLYKWCGEKTNGVIKQVGLDFSNGNMTAVNALYFKSYWTEKFSESETKTNVFYGTTSSSYVKMMHKKALLKCTTLDDFTALSIPYGNEAYSMQLVLPSKGCDMDQAGKLLAEGLLDDLTTQARKTVVHVELPRFEMTHEFSAKEILKVMGIKDAFDVNSANFSKLADGPLCLKDLNQVGFIHVDESGDSAAKCNCGTTCTCGDIGDPDLTVSFNRPFFFFIREKSTGLILFMGKVEEL